jgi:hypothetical protein
MRMWALMEDTSMANEETPRRRFEYELGHSDRELKRLAAQAALVDPITRQYLTRAGVSTGMWVLDIGSGAGDVAFFSRRKLWGRQAPLWDPTDHRQRSKQPGSELRSVP